MLERFFDAILASRARRLAVFLHRHLPTAGEILDIGSGTGHNAHTLRAVTNLRVIETDVVDIHVVGPGPVLFDGIRLPFAENQFATSVLLFVLHYASQPENLLREAARVASGNVFLLQSSYATPTGRWIWSFRDFVTGRLAFRIARCCGYVRAEHCPLVPHEYFSRQRLEEVIRVAGLRIADVQRFDGVGNMATRDLYRLERMPL